jgi:hypothetical protein
LGIEAGAENDCKSEGRVGLRSIAERDLLLGSTVRAHRVKP